MPPIQWLIAFTAGGASINSVIFCLLESSCSVARTVPGVHESLLELAEEPGLWLPPEPSRKVFAGDGYSVVTSGRSAWVQRIRLERRRVEAAVDEVRALLREQGFAEVTWWVGERSTPVGPVDPARAARPRAGPTRRS